MGASSGDGGAARLAVRVRTVLGDEVTVPAQQRCRLDEEAPEAVPG